MRVLRKPKNPTFNEFLPSLIMNNNIFLFDNIFANQYLIDKIFEIYGVNNDEELQFFVKYSFDSNLRMKYGCREIDSSILCAGIVTDFTPLTSGTDQEYFF